MGGDRSRWFLILVLVVAVLGVGAWLGIWKAQDGRLDPLGDGELSYRRGDWRGAEDRARAALKAKPSDPAALRLRARSAARQGRDESAEAIYRRLGTGSMEAEDFFLLGRGLLARGQVGPALASLGAARDAEPDHAETLDALSRYWAESRALTDALDATERLFRRPGWEVRAGVRLGRLRAELFDPAGAAEVLASALARDPKLEGADLDPPAVARLLVRCWLEVGRPAEAREWIKDFSGRGLDPESSWLMSRALLQERKAAEAASALEAARGFGASDPLMHEPAPFVGAASCASCHPAEYRSQQGSRHSRTLVRTGDLEGIPWPDRDIPDVDNGKVAHRFSRVDDRVEAVTTVEGNAFRAVVEYALGANHQGRSFLGRESSGQVRELRISQYPHPPEWGRTMEHPAVPPDEPGYLGRPITAEATRKCLGCHATNFRAAREPGGRPEGRDRGIGCERCHGPGGNHLLAIAARFPEPAIARPRLAPAARVVALCGECHHAPNKTTPADAGFVRYQASSLVLSRCYIESAEALSCVTCHDPHKDAETSASYYEGKCLSCHVLPGPSAPGRPAGSSRNGKMCPVNPRKDCLNCHMPAVKDAVPRTVFTDHRIRVRRP
jgi:tetratricopeptide (TPR) repeat protein